MRCGDAPRPARLAHPLSANLAHPFSARRVVEQRAHAGNRIVSARPARPPSAFAEQPSLTLPVPMRLAIASAFECDDRNAAGGGRFVCGPSLTENERDAREQRPERTAPGTDDRAPVAA